MTTPRKMILAVALAVAVLLAISAPGSADVVTVTNGTATITAGAGFVTITLTDTAFNPVSVIQNISGFVFSTSTGGDVALTTVSPNPAATYIAVSSSGSTTTDAGPAIWVYSGSSAQYVLLWNGTGTTGPAYTILGAPGAGDTYSAANGSIANNSPHNPFIDQTATFVLYIDGVTAGTTFSDLSILFGTSPGIPQVPEPGSLMLLGAGLVGLAWMSRRRT